MSKRKEPGNADALGMNIEPPVKYLKGIKECFSKMVNRPAEITVYQCTQHGDQKKKNKPESHCMARKLEFNDYH